MALTEMFVHKQRIIREFILPPLADFFPKTDIRLQFTGYLLNGFRIQHHQSVMAFHMDWLFNGYCDVLAEMSPW